MGPGARRACALSQGVIADVRWRGLGGQRYSLRCGQLRVFDPLFNAVNRTSSRALAVGGRRGDTSVRDEMVQFEADHAIVGGRNRQSELFHHTECAPSPLRRRSVVTEQGSSATRPYPQSNTSTCIRRAKATPSGI